MNKRMRKLRMLIIFGIWMMVMFVISLKAMTVEPNVKPLPLPEIIYVD